MKNKSNTFYKCTATFRTHCITTSSLQQNHPSQANEKFEFFVGLTVDHELCV
jgi:hypothetical protein